MIRMIAVTDLQEWLGAKAAAADASQKRWAEASERASANGRLNLARYYDGRADAAKDEVLRLREWITDCELLRSSAHQS